jgi:Lon protease-like protein
VQLEVQLVPLFPLPNVVLFPDVPLPLHVFEPRYRALVTDALSSHRTIGMALLKPGYEADYHGRPPIYPIGCSGSIVREERLDDGRYNIVLHGRERFRIVEEQQGAPYRLALVEPLSEPARDDGTLDRLGEQVLAAVGRMAGAPSVVVQGEVSTAALVNGLCQELDLPAVEKLDLLACDSLESRARRLVELLDFHRLEKASGRPGAMN